MENEGGDRREGDGGDGRNRDRGVRGNGVNGCADDVDDDGKSEVNEPEKDGRNNGWASSLPSGPFASSSGSQSLHELQRDGNFST